VTAATPGPAVAESPGVARAARYRELAARLSGWAVRARAEGRPTEAGFLVTAAAALRCAARYAPRPEPVVVLAWKQRAVCGVDAPEAETPGHAEAWAAAARPTP